MPIQEGLTGSSLAKGWMRKSPIQPNPEAENPSGVADAFIPVGIGSWHVHGWFGVDGLNPEEKWARVGWFWVAQGIDSW